MSQLALFLVGAGLGIIAPLVAVIAVRRRTTSETDHNEAAAADVLSQGAVRLVPYYESRIASLEARLTVAEAATLIAQRTATDAREAEQRCLTRLDAMQAQIDALLTAVANPPVTTTVTTAVTTHDPMPPTDPTIQETS